MFRKGRKQADFAAEIGAHIELEAARLRQEGMSVAEADSAARRKFGNVLRAEERFYESRHVLWLEDICHDLHYATRMIRRAPAFAVTVILTIALGIGATAAIFAVADTALIKPLPFPQSQRIVSLYEKWNGDLASFAPADYLEFQRQARSFESLAAYRHDPFNVTGQNRPERVLGAITTPNFFSVFGVPAGHGRTLNASRDRPGGPRTVVLSYSLWQRRYAGSRDVVGQVIQVNGEPATIIGVMPPYFTFPNDADMWMAARFQVPEHPLRPSIDLSASRGSHYFDIVARLKPNVTTLQAQAEIEVITRRLKAQYKDAEEGDGAALLSLRDDLVGNTRPAILILLVAVAVLFVVACANVTNIVLARGAARHREIALRGSLGAGRLRLIRQLIVESSLLSLAGAVLGLAGVRYALRSLETLLPLDVLPADGLHIDFRVVGFTTVIAMLAAILFGLFPAIQTARIDLNSALKEAGRNFTDGAHANRSRKVLLIVQVALAAILLIGAGLLIRSLDRLLSASQGFTSDHLLTLQMSLPQAEYKMPADRSRFATEVLARVSALPGIRSTAVTSRLPLDPGGSRRGIQIKGRSSAPGSELSPDYLVVSPDYFRTLHVPVLEGRVFTERDTANASGAVIVNQAMARHFWPNTDPVGQYIKVDRLDWSQVIGVVGNVSQHVLGEAPRPALYVPYAQYPWPALTLLIRTSMDPTKLAPAAIAAVHAIDKDEPVYGVRSMDEVIVSSIRVRRFRTVLLSMFAVLALALAAIGTYGVMTYSVTQRKHEIGVRLALGAQPQQVRALVVGEGLRLAGLGIAAGVVVSFALTRFLSGILYGVGSSDPLSFASGILLLFIAALFASYVPARRAMKMNPASIFRGE